MINPEELRFGNLVQYQDKIWSIFCLKEGKAVIVSQNNDVESCPYEELEPLEITRELVRGLGFVELESDDEEFDGSFIIEPDTIYYCYAIMLTFREFEDRKDCTVSIYMEETEAHVLPEDLIEKEDWTEEDKERAKNFTIFIPERSQPIAYNLKYMHRLQNIYRGLTGEEELIRT